MDIPANARQAIEEVLWNNYSNLTPAALRILTTAIYRRARKRQFADGWQTTLRHVVMTRKYDATRRWVDVLEKREPDDSPPHD